MALKAYSQSCTRNVPGNSYLFVTESANINTIAISNGEVTGIVMNSGTYFQQIEADENSIRRRRRKVGNAHAYDHEIDFRCSKPSLLLTELSEELADGSPCRMIAITYDSNGQSWLVGWSEADKGVRGLLLNNDDLDTGENITARNRQLDTYKLKTKTAHLELPLSSILNEYIKSEIMIGLGNAIPLNFAGAGYGPELHTSANAASDPNGNEANATTGWTQTGLDVGANVFESQGAVKNTGSYAIHGNCNDTPTSGAKFQVQVSTEIGATYKITGKHRHVGTGDYWTFVIGASTIGTINNSVVTFQDIDELYVATATTTTLKWQEGGAGNDGGMYADDLSVKKVL